MCPKCWVLCAFASRKKRQLPLSCLPVCMFICLSVCLSIGLSACISEVPTGCISVQSGMGTYMNICRTTPYFVKIWKERRTLCTETQGNFSFAGDINLLWKLFGWNGIRLLVSPSVRPYASARLPLEGFTWNLILGIFLYICRESSKFGQNRATILDTLREDLITFYCY